MSQKNIASNEKLNENSNEKEGFQYNDENFEIKLSEKYC